MDATEVLAELTRRGVKIMVEGDRLRFRPQQAVTPDLRAAMAAHKAELLTLLDGDEPEVRWRADAMRLRMPPTGVIPPIYARSLTSPTPPGDCLSCGEPLTPGNKYHCEPCVKAAWLVLREVRSDGV